MKQKILILSLSLLCVQAYAVVNVMPEIRTTIAVSKADINRVSCSGGLIHSIDYAANTGLTHTIHQNKKNVVLLFKQLDVGGTRKIIGRKVNILIGCNEEYYPMILDPQEIDSQSIFLQTSKLETQSRKKNQEKNNKTREKMLVDLIISARENIQGTDDLQDAFYIGDLQIKPLKKQDISGTNYQVTKFVVISNNSVNLVEKQFLDTRLSRHPISAISLDDFNLNQEKNWTHLYLVGEK